MTEAEWLNGPDHDEMIRYVKQSHKGRQIRLFCLACCRRVWGFLPDARSRAAIEAMEIAIDAPGAPLFRDSRGVSVLFATEMATTAVGTADNPLLAALYASEAVSYTAGGVTTDIIRTPLSAVIMAAHEAFREADETFREGDEADQLSPADAVLGQTDKNEEAAQRDLIRDIFGNPFRPVNFSPSWRTSTTVALASRMYESRDFSAMPILADALQDAGCDSANVLDHCRGPGPHVRGCWVVDLVLGKE